MSTFCWSNSLDILAITVNGFLSPLAGAAEVAAPVLGKIATASPAEPPKSPASSFIDDKSSSEPAVETATVPLVVVLAVSGAPCIADCL